MWLTQDNAKFEIRIETHNKLQYQSKAKILTWNQYLDYLIDQSFQGVNKLFVISFENNI